MYNTNKYEAILFDMDGTVLHSENLFSKAELKLLEYYGIYAELSDLSEFKGMSPDEFYINFKSKFNLVQKSETLKKQLITYLYHIFETELEYVEGFKDFYQKHILVPGIKTALVTNTERNIVNKIIEYTSIDKYFSTIITSDDVLKNKPSPDPYLKSMLKLNVDPKYTLIVEDSSIGIASALKSGADVVAIRTTLTNKQVISIDKKLKSFDKFDDISKFLTCS